MSLPLSVYLSIYFSSSVAVSFIQSSIFLSFLLSLRTVLFLQGRLHLSLHRCLLISLFCYPFSVSFVSYYLFVLSRTHLFLVLVVSLCFNLCFSLHLCVLSSDSVSSFLFYLINHSFVVTHSLFSLFSLSCNVCLPLRPPACLYIIIGLFTYATTHLFLLFLPLIRFLSHFPSLFLFRSVFLSFFFYLHVCLFALYYFISLFLCSIAFGSACCQGQNVLQLYISCFI